MCMYVFVPWLHYRYREACEAAKAAVVEQLQALARSLQAHLNAIMCAANLCIIAKALSAHVSQGTARGWTFPALIEAPPVSQTPPLGQPLPLPQAPLLGQTTQTQQGLFQDVSQDTPGAPPPLVLKGLFPYWLHPAGDHGTRGGVPSSALHGVPTSTPDGALSGVPQGEAPFSRGPVVRNDVAMPAMFLLTGPNGGGKSSLLRSICAASLLASCGLMVPAAAAQVRWTCRYHVQYLQVQVICGFMYCTCRMNDLLEGWPLCIQHPFCLWRVVQQMLRFLTKALRLNRLLVVDPVAAACWLWVCPRCPASTPLCCA